MLWTPSQKVLTDNFINRIKTVEWFKHAGEPSEKYWVVDTIWEACDTHGRKTREVWEKNSEILEQKALQNSQTNKSTLSLKPSAWLSATRWTKPYAHSKTASVRRPGKTNQALKMKFWILSNAIQHGPVSNY